MHSVAISYCLADCFTRIGNTPGIEIYWRVVPAIWELGLTSRYHGIGGWSETNFTATVKFLDPENPQLGAEMVVVSSIQAELLPIFC